ncbi:hypothetical protein [Roseisolibacter sp. H3M3-2]|uniref:hypothetical protein n=1 Tax=Roseisolibacter sp. H3M3-2 TaxID=3031323 RepID=UPI0023DBC204|nr:hypothetical protein [Roseisolibacter sp. H3M3-2]MDF1504787.1 hypothetical protein [Roseisolibacter sp. H3M3-2]
MRPSALSRPASLALLALCACAGEPPTGARVAVAAPSRAAAPERPMRGDCETTFPRLQGPPVGTIRQVDVGTCRLTHLGRAALYSSKVIDFAAGTQATDDFRLTAADGDQLFGAGSGTSAPAGPGRIAFRATMTLTGGTGRFAGARGALRIEGVADVATASSTMRVVDGWIAY